MASSQRLQGWKWSNQSRPSSKRRRASRCRQPWVVSGSLAAVTAPWQEAVTTVDTSTPAPADASTIAAAYVATASVDAAVQSRETDGSSAATVLRQAAATTVDTSAPPLLEVPIDAAAASTAYVDAAVQPREMDASAPRLHRDR